MSQKNCNVLCWNVRGLNTAARKSVRNIVQSSGATIVCLQETKKAHWNAQLVVETLGPKFAKNFVALLTAGTRGGILIAALENHFNLQNSTTTEHTISTTIIMKANNQPWTLTGIYGPQRDQEKLIFINELKNLKSQMLVASIRRLQPHL